METADDGISFGSYLTQQTPAMPTPSCRLWLQFPFEAMIWETLEIISDPADSRPLSLFGLFEFRHLLTGWRLDGRQHDVAEFLSLLQQNPVGSA